MITIKEKQKQTKNGKYFLYNLILTFLQTEIKNLSFSVNVERLYLNLNLRVGCWFYMNLYIFYFSFSSCDIKTAEK